MPVPDQRQMFKELPTAARARLAGAHIATYLHAHRGELTLDQCSLLEEWSDFLLSSDRLDSPTARRATAALIARGEQLFTPQERDAVLSWLVDF